MEHDARCDKQDNDVSAIRGDLRVLCDRVPPDLKEQLTRLHADIESVERTVAESDKHVWTAINSLSADFKSDRAQWRVILMTIAVSFIGLFSAWVFKGGMFK